ncbi:MAG: GNAT family N-acetyltransferase [Xanthobacteraceae bacterium]
MHAIRRAGADDVAAVARLFRTVRRASLPYLPDLHTPDEDLGFFRDRVFAECEVCVARAEAIDAFIAFRTGWVDHLYVRPERHRQGLGKALLTLAMTAHAPLRLWVFQRNTAAISFHRACGFRAIERTDGSRNEEREPDVLMEWTRT